MKKIILTGSLAYDYIFDVPVPFSKYILPEKIHQINISIVTDRFKKSYGGTAGNQAFYLNKLRMNPYVYASAGNDFSEYKNFLKKHKVDTIHIKIAKNLHTASGFVMTDKRDNQIWMFTVGAMKEATKLKLKNVIKRNSSSFVMISPNNYQAMNQYVNECVKHRLDFAFDPASAIPHLDQKVVTDGVKFAKIIFGNDYEIAFSEKRIGKKLISVLNKNQILVKTLADQGSEIFHQGKWIKIGIYKTKTVDPTGAGDAYRAGFLYGYLNNQPIKTCGWMGAVTASFAVEVKGTMNLKFTKKQFEKRLFKVI